MAPLSLHSNLRTNTDLLTNHRCRTYPVRREWLSLHLPIRQNQSFDTAYCKMDGVGSVRPIPHRCHIVGISLW
ncbi:hypothetical protein DN30_3607 [Vibrio cholerae]|nr:hypothetical protein DN30_3607 [Vibrio cholerae]